MNPKKSGTLFIVLMIALIAFGIASAANLANIGTDTLNGINIPNLSLNSQQQVTAIGDPDFLPVYISKHAVINITNNTTTPVVPTNNTTNPSVPTNG